jgi:ABC-2 type transport system permease protein
LKGFLAAFWAESLKVRRSKMLLVTILIFAFIAIMMGLLLFVVKHPELAGRSATIGTKASVIAKADWPSYTNLLIQTILALGPMGFGIVTSWVFGREYSDRVIKDLLALPVSRLVIILAKFSTIIIWCLLLSLTLFVFGILAGMAVNLTGWSVDTVYHFFIKFAGSSFLTILLVTPVAFIASYGRGYLLPIGFTILTLILTQLIFIGIPGITPYFPWALPALYSGVAGIDVPQPGCISYMLFFFTIVSGLLGTILWWRFSDQT